MDYTVKFDTALAEVCRKHVSKCPGRPCRWTPALALLLIEEVVEQIGEEGGDLMYWLIVRGERTSLAWQVASADSDWLHRERQGPDYHMSLRDIRDDLRERNSGDRMRGFRDPFLRNQGLTTPQIEFYEGANQSVGEVLKFIEKRIEKVHQDLGDLRCYSTTLRTQIWINILSLKGKKLTRDMYRRLFLP